MKPYNIATNPLDSSNVGFGWEDKNNDENKKKIFILK